MKYGLVMCKPVGFGSSNETVDEVVADDKEKAISYFNKKYPNLNLDKNGYHKYGTTTITIAEINHS